MTMDRVEVLAYYTDTELADLLSRNGFRLVHMCAAFDDALIRRCESASLIVLANRASG